MQKEAATMTDSQNTGKILIVDDEASIRKFLRISLEAKGYTILEATNGRHALEQAALKSPDLIILDLGLPDMDGKLVIKELRTWSHTPLIVLSVRSDETEKVEALDLGANDYVTKPFGIAELLARFRVLLRPQNTDIGAGNESLFARDGLEINYAHRTVSMNGKMLRLTRKEYEILCLLARNAGKVLTQDFLLRQIWGPAHTGEAQYLRVHIGKLRQKLGDDAAAPLFIVTEPGVGYRFTNES